MALVAVGVGETGSAAERGAAAARRALDGLAGRKPAAAVVLSAYHGLDHHAALAQVRALLGPTPLVGGTTFGEIVGARHLEGSVVVWLLAGDDVRAAEGLGLGMAADSFAAGAESARL